MLALLLRCWLWSGLLFASLCQAITLDVPAEAVRLSLAAGMEYFLDADASLSLADAMGDDRYQPMTTDGLSLGFRSGVLWARVSLRNPGPTPIERVLAVKPERLESVHLYVPQAGGFLRLDNGLQVPVLQRPVPNRVLAFPLRLEAGESAVLYLRVESRTRLSLQLALWTPEAFEDTARREELLAVLAMGILLGVALYSLALLRRDRLFLYVGLEGICVCLANVGRLGLDHAYLWPDRPDVSFLMTPLSAMLAPIFLNRAMLLLLPLQRYDWRGIKYLMHALLLVQLALCVTILLGGTATTVFPAVLILTLVSKVFYLAVAGAAWRKGFTPASYAFVALLLATLLSVPYTVDILWGAPLGPAVNVVTMVFLSALCQLLFLAGATQRGELAHQEREAAQEESLAAQRNTATWLEAQVVERTHALNLAKERAERADQAKGEFLARVSHELRTPLHLILGYTHLLQQEVPKQALMHLTLLEEGGLQLARLVDDLLDFARGERNGMVLDTKPTPFNMLLQRLKAYGQSLARQHHQFTDDFAENLPPALRMDGQRLEQVLLILLANATHHTREGHIALRIQARAEAAGWVRLYFAVEDTGDGIPPADLERIFQPFERVIGGEHKGGLGLGLAIARQIVHAFGGELRVDSRVGEGSRFWFEISLALAAEEEIQPQNAPEKLMGYSGTAKSILVVEDHTGNRQLLEQLLAETGFGVHSAGGVNEALVLLASVPVHLVLLDQRLPDGSAWDILRALRGKGGDMPAILLSAQPPHPPDDWGHQPGFDAVLLKPVNGTEILASIGSVLGLTWQRALAATRESENLPHPVSGDAGFAPDELAELAEWVRQGAWYEIEAWIARLRLKRPEKEAFYLMLEQRLVEMDFPGMVEYLGTQGYVGA